MAAYWVGRVKIHDPVQFKKYTDLIPAIFAEYGAKVMTRGGKYEVLEGPSNFDRYVVIEFPSFEQAVACHDSDAYKAAQLHRAGGLVSTSEVVIIEGGEFTK